MVILRDLTDRVIFLFNEYRFYWITFLGYEIILYFWLVKYDISSVDYSFSDMFH